MTDHEKLAIAIQALKDVVDPLAAMRRYAESKGSKLSGMVYHVVNRVAHVQGIAREALESINGVEE